MLFIPHDRLAYHLVQDKDAEAAYRLLPARAGIGRPAGN
jgi:hypothetical protein